MYKDFFNNLPFVAYAMFKASIVKWAETFYQRFHHTQYADPALGAILQMA